jgi:Cytochrome bd terminal oxidase subunit I
MEDLRGIKHEGRTISSPYPLRFNDCASLLVSAVDDGPRPLIVVLKTLAIKTGNDACSKPARFWTNIFGINFAICVVIGIPMEFEFGTNG